MEQLLILHGSVTEVSASPDQRSQTLCVMLQKLSPPAAGNKILFSECDHRRMKKEDLRRNSVFSLDLS